MAKVHGSYIKTQINKTKVGEDGIFKAYVIEGIENFNLKKVFRASVSSDYDGATGIFYDNFEEAKSNALSILKKMILEFEEEIKALRKLYNVE